MPASPETDAFSFGVATGAGASWGERTAGVEWPHAATKVAKVNVATKPSVIGRNMV